MVRLDDVRRPPAGARAGQTDHEDRKTWYANGTGCTGEGQRPELEQNCWWRWYWSATFPDVRDRLYVSDAILTAEMKRRITARLGARCPAGTLYCMPAPALSDVLYVPAGPNAKAFARHAAAITKANITTEIATPIIMHLLPVPPQPFPAPGRFFGLTGPDRANALRLLDPGSTLSAEYGHTKWGAAGSKWDPRFKIPPANKHGCSFTWLQ